MPLAYSQWFINNNNKYCGPTMCQALSLGLGLSSNSLARTRYNLLDVPFASLDVISLLFSLPHSFLCHFLTFPHRPTLKMLVFFCLFVCLFFYRLRKHPQTNQFLKQQPNLFFLRAGPLEMLILPPLSTCSSDHRNQPTPFH